MGLLIYVGGWLVYQGIHNWNIIFVSRWVGLFVVGLVIGGGGFNTEMSLLFC